MFRWFFIFCIGYGGTVLLIFALAARRRMKTNQKEMYKTVRFQQQTELKHKNTRAFHYSFRVACTIANQRSALSGFGKVGLEGLGVMCFVFGVLCVCVFVFGVLCVCVFVFGVLCVCRLANFFFFCLQTE